MSKHRPHIFQAGLRQHALLAALLLGVLTILAIPAGAEPSIKVDGSGNIVASDELRHIPPRHENGQTILTVKPGSAVSISPILKNANLIDIRQTPQGQQIIIHSDAVSFAPKSDAPPAEKKPATPQASGIQPISHTPATQAAPPPKRPAAQAAPATAPAQQAPVQTRHVTPPVAPKPRPTVTQLPLPSAEHPAALSAVAESHAEPASAPGDAPATAEPVKTVPAEELVPVFSDKPQPPAGGITSSFLIRLVASLLVVLVVLVGFMKKVLPKLAQRYPQAVEHLKRQSQQTQQPTDSLIGLPKPRRDAVDDIPAPPANPADKTELPLVRDSGQRDYLQQWGNQGDNRFHLITSARLGRDKELHLVEIKGHQLVIATTPYTINLITELPTDEAAGAPVLNLDEVLHNEARNAELYKKYLAPGATPGATAKTRLLEETPRPAAATAQPRPATAKTTGYAASDIVDAEDVVVLSDYDDVYRP